MAVRLFMDPDHVKQIPNISYYHISHQNKIASSCPGAEVTIPQVFRDEGRRWTDDPSLSDLSLVMKKPPGAAAVAPVLSIPVDLKVHAMPAPSAAGKRTESILKGVKARHGKRIPSQRRRTLEE